MKIGVVSDTHGCSSTWEKIMKKYFHHVDLIIHGGDVLYHGPRNPVVEEYNPPELAKMINALDIPIFITRGNCDAAVDQYMINWPIQSPYLFLNIEGLSILANHGDDIDESKLLSMLDNYGAGIFISGHTHIPRLEKVNNHIILNPGSCLLPKGGNPPTVAFIEDNEVYIVDINTNTKLKSIQR